MVNLGGLLEEQGDLDGARAAYQRAIDSGDPDQARRRWATSGCCSPNRATSRGLGPPTSGPSTPATPTGAEGDGGPGRAARRAGRPRRGSGRLPAGHRLRPPRPGAEGDDHLGRCSPSRAIWTGPGRLPAGHRHRPPRRRRRRSTDRSSPATSRGRAIWTAPAPPTSRASTRATPTMAPSGDD